MNQLKVLVNNGWTIQNRRLLASRVGKEQCRNLSEAFKIYSLSDTQKSVPIDKIKLNNDGDCLRISFGLQNESALSFIDKNINIENIKNALNILFKKEIPATKIDFNPSKIMDKLFTAEFSPKEHINDDGYFVTTIIDKKDGKPVEAYIKKVELDERDKKDILFQGLPREKWEMYVKNGVGKYERVGIRKFGLDYVNSKIDSGYMESKEGREKYQGIGIRLHQLVVERMLQEGFDNVEVESTFSAFPFHYKCGFRLSPEGDFYEKPELEVAISRWSKILNLSGDEIKKKIVLEDLGNAYYVDYKEIENIKKSICILGDGKIPFENTTMVLDKANLDKWKERVLSQPIILDKEKGL